MPNLVGIGNSQAPTNAMLGGLAYQDSVAEINIDKIKAITSDTATDIFVYDTCKDSDGGAWRHRTQNTSWYNEGASATRGSRKEFPAIAVIVAERNFITIYDGDDPNLPMWMRFNTIANGASQGMLNRPMIQIQGVDKVVHMLNGILVTGTKNEGSNYGQPVINFISEKVLRMDSQTGEGGEWIGNIAQRNEAIGYKPVDYDYVIKASHVFDVAMTVLPNAQIDDSTGLPIPTIAVATPSGVSVIRDDGTVVDHYDSAGGESTQVAFTQDGKLAHSHDGHTGIRIDSLSGTGSGDFNYGSNKVAKHNSEEFYINYGLISSGWSGNAPKLNEGAFNSRGQIVPVQDNILAENSTKGLNLLARDFPNSPDNNRIAYITSNYNTGYMVGDIKGAFLSSTDDTNLGTNLLTVGTFDSASGWTLSGTGAFSISGGKLNGNGTSGVSFAQRAETPALITSGLTYTVKAVVTRTSGNLYARVANSSYSVNIGSTNTHYISLTAGNVPTETVLFYSDGFNGTIDNVEVYIEDQDRSVNNKGLQVYGTVTKTPVVAGAELVAYSGFSASNYLQQPYNSDLDFGTGDLSIIFWYKLTSTGTPQCFIHRGDGGSGTWGSGNLIQIEMDTTYLEFQLSGSSFTPLTQVSVPVAQSVTGQWQHFVGVRKDGYMHVYIDGVKYGNVASTQNVTNTSAKLWVGQRPNSSRPLSNGSMALLRMSSTAPTPEQVKKMYDDEKCLFHENAKCTLHGTSDDVTALAFDDTNGVLHAGTSSGRSEFHGLNRINNTTTAVTTAISASNGLVAEQ